MYKYIFSPETWYGKNECPFMNRVNKKCWLTKICFAFWTDKFGLFVFRKIGRKRTEFVLNKSQISGQASCRTLDRRFQQKDATERCNPQRCLVALEFSWMHFCVMPWVNSDSHVSHPLTAKLFLISWFPHPWKIFIYNPVRGTLSWNHGLSLPSQNHPLESFL